MYQIRHHLGTNLVLCKGADGDYLHWQDESFLVASPKTAAVQATTVERLAEEFTIISVLYTIPHEDIVIWDTELDRVIPMPYTTWKSFDARVQTRIVDRTYNVELGLFLDGLVNRGKYIEERSGQSLVDYELAKMFGPAVPPPSTIVRPNSTGRSHFKRLQREAKAAAVAPAPATEEGGIEFSDDPKHMYGVKTTFWQDVAITLGLSFLINNK